MEIEFRGVRKSNGNFIYGSLIYRPYGFAENEKEYAAIILFDKYSDSSYNAYLEEEVIPESVGQYTGLKDKNGTKIFEGDFVQLENSVRVFEFYKNCFWLIHPTKGFKFPINMITDDHLKSIEVIGNIHQNSELLE
jgi:uncharacterized phage protein (TIGR01671 family)